MSENQNTIFVLGKENVTVFSRNQQVQVKQHGNCAILADSKSVHSKWTPVLYKSSEHSTPSEDGWQVGRLPEWKKSFLRFKWCDNYDHLTSLSTKGCDLTVNDSCLPSWFWINCQNISPNFIFDWVVERDHCYCRFSKLFSQMSKKSVVITSYCNFHSPFFAQ